MAFEPLPVNYTDAVWSGLKRYNEINNEDGTVSFQDVTAYSNKQNSFFGAKDANRMNEALNYIMNALEGGTDLYTAFQNYFNEQQAQFGNEYNQRLAYFNETLEDTLERTQSTSTADVERIKQEFDDFTEDLKTQSRADFNEWFNLIKDQLSEDAAGNLQLQLDRIKNAPNFRISSGFTVQPGYWEQDGNNYRYDIYGNTTENDKVDIQLDGDAILQLMDDGVKAIYMENLTPDGEFGMIRVWCLGGVPSVPVKIKYTVIGKPTD